MGKYEPCFTIFTLHYAYSAVVFDAVVPETRGRELLSDDHSHAMYYTLAHSHNVACGENNMRLD